jgi:hypothetical protein
MKMVPDDYPELQLQLQEYDFTQPAPSRGRIARQSAASGPGTETPQFTGRTVRNSGRKSVAVVH